MKRILMALVLLAGLAPSFAMAACEVADRNGTLVAVAANGGECLKGEPLHGASQRMGDLVLASERFCETPRAEYIEAVKNDGVFTRRFHLRCTYVGSDCSPAGRVKGDIVFSR